MIASSIPFLTGFSASDPGVIDLMAGSRGDECAALVFLVLREKGERERYTQERMAYKFLEIYDILLLADTQPAPGSQPWLARIHGSPAKCT